MSEPLTPPAEVFGQEELAEVSAAYLKATNRGRLEGSGEGAGAGSQDALAAEMADLLGFLLLFADWQGIDLETAFCRKWGQHLDDEYERDHTGSH